MDNNKKMAIIEGLLFVNGDEGTTIEDLQFILEDISQDEIEVLIDDLSHKYKNDSSSGLDIQKFAKNKFRMITKKENAEFYTKLANVKTESKLSTASIETLSIIAYKGPISRTNVEDIRGVNCETIFYKLKLRNLIEEAGKSQEIGKPMLYRVTEDFLKYFNLNSLDELPELKETIKEEKDIFNRGA
ncbi:SMC-Scp complex subunit ScpB [Spiroplasma diminutum]|uniref:Segregation and condensation protein B n=1 Tax=Spiroplasma diminutum CUAS-1 TaxID=1276221 RepID=S5LVT0_9MOLU|nr:SMC-Scp complex subunit ScpB [Spiroplasma diminutum]AGR41939.1 chromosome condensation and segregation factor B [Spiroplasma diminutum CUAS-1]